ncbi:MAG: hypothetical protein ACR2NK_12170 [Mariniblastus sp.]
MPIKLDVSSPEYAQWRRDHTPDGNGIPQLFIVRADGETLYGRSGSLRGPDLPNMLISALQNSGRILSAREAQSLVEAADKFTQEKNKGNFESAIKAISRVRKIGEPGQIQSYSEPALRVNRLVIETADEVRNQLKKLANQIETDHADIKLKAMLGYLKLREDFGALKMVKPDLAAFQKKYTLKDNKQLAREAKIIESANQANTKSKKTRAIATLTELIGETEIEPVRKEAEKKLSALQQELEAG